VNAPWEDRVVLITGGTRGIGRSIALRLAEERPRHIRLAYCMNHEAARETLAAIEAMGVSASVTVCEVSDAEMQKDMFARLREEWGRVDVFVANAARTAFRPALELDQRSWRRTMQACTDCSTSRLRSPATAKGRHATSTSQTGSAFGTCLKT